MYRLVRGFVAVLYRIGAEVHIKGAENVPPGGPLLIAMNHLSYFDPPLVLISVPRKMTVFAARKYRRNPFLRILFEGMGCIWVRQAEADHDALRSALERLKAGAALGISPEGTRSRATHALQPARNGAAFLASRSGVPVLPLALWGTDHLASDLRHLRRGKVFIRIGKPFQINASPRAKGAALDEITEKIMSAIAALLPPEYRGVYADHPRLQGFLEGKTG
jgi:1-acyl-sn-glycerol-3-phosphate acyltransferase